MPSELPIEKPAEAHSGAFCVILYDFTPDTSGNWTFHLKEFKLTFTISSLYRLQEEMGTTNAILVEVEKQLAEQGKTLDDILDQQTQTNDKLDDVVDQQQQTNDKLDNIQGSVDELPGDIKDSMGDLIQEEETRAWEAGDSVAGDLSDTIPDYSDGFMQALQGFASSMSYSGTDAKLPIPALILPEIPGVIPRTVILDEMEIDFGEYLQMLPESLLLLVQSLFTMQRLIML